MSSPPRRPLVSGNWKMNLDHTEALHLVRDLGLRLAASDLASVDASLHPPFTALRTVQTLIEGENLPFALGAQHCSSHADGPFTGEVSARMLARLGVSLVIVGHSERRRLFGMHDEVVGATLRRVVEHGMVPICCVGETQEERDRGQTREVVHRQLAAALAAVPPDAVPTMVIAYEPLWAIGTGQAATAEDAQDAAAFIRASVADGAGQEAAGLVRIQYGGSVTGANAAELLGGPDVDGLLVGGASLSAASFLDVIRGVAGCYGS